MAGKSKIYSLPAEVRAQLDRLILEQSSTYEEILGWLHRQGYTEISSSSLGRYAKTKKNIFDTADRVRGIITEINAAGLDIDEAADTLAGQKLLETLSLLDIESDGENGDGLADLQQLLPQLVKIQKLITDRRRLSAFVGGGTELDRPAAFLESLQFIAEVLKENDPEALKGLARNYDLIVELGKERFSK